MKPLIAGILAAITVLAQAKLPPYTRDMLPNGATVLLMPRAGVPLVHVRVLVKGGVESDPPKLAGLASITAALLRSGSTKRTADQFSAELDGLGGVFGAGVDGAATFITAEFLKKDLEAGLDLVSDALLKPSFPEEEVRRELARAVDRAKGAKDNAQFALQSYAVRAFFGPTHPYGNPADETSLASIRRQDIAEYHARQYRGRNFIIILSGDFDAAAAKSKMLAAFGAAPAGTAFAWPTAPLLKRKGGLLLVDKPDATQTYFSIAQPGIARNDPDATKIELVNTLFGGRFTSMLNDALRVNSGLTYGAASQVQLNRLPGAISINTYTKSETTTQAIDMALDILTRLNQKGITAEQMASAKAYMKGQYATRRLETIEQLASMLATIELYGLGADEVNRFYARVDAITLDEANAVARKYYQPGDLTLVLVGPAAKIREAVKKYDPKPLEMSIRDAGWGQ